MVNEGFVFDYNLENFNIVIVCHELYSFFFFYLATGLHKNCSHTFKEQVVGDRDLYKDSIV